VNETTILRRIVNKPVTANCPSKHSLNFPPPVLSRQDPRDLRFRSLIRHHRPATIRSVGGPPIARIENRPCILFSLRIFLFLQPNTATFPPSPAGSPSQHTLHPAALKLVVLVYRRNRRQYLRILDISQVVAIITPATLRSFTISPEYTVLLVGCIRRPLDNRWHSTPKQSPATSAPTVHRTLAMPPQRTVPPAKAIKTERTHEENQERLVPQACYPW
jgi:hypothetical protein